MAGRRPISAVMLDADVRKKETDEIEQRINAEPIYESQIFEVPDELMGDEVKKWHELVKLIVAIENHPLSDAHKDKMIAYCKCWVRAIRHDKIYQSDPNDKDNYKRMLDEWKLHRQLTSDLVLDVVSMAKIGKARNDYRKKKVDPIVDIRDRSGK